MIMNIRQRLNKNYNELNGLYHDISMKLGLSDSESMVMYMLYDIQEPLTQSDIVKAMTKKHLRCQNNQIQIKSAFRIHSQ